MGKCKCENSECGAPKGVCDDARGKCALRMMEIVALGGMIERIATERARTPSAETAGDLAYIKGKLVTLACYATKTDEQAVRDALESAMVEMEADAAPDTGK